MDRGAENGEVRKERVAFLSTSLALIGITPDPRSRTPAFTTSMPCRLYFLNTNSTHGLCKYIILRLLGEQMLTLEKIAR